MPALRKAIAPCSRILVTPLTSKHRIFCWLHKTCIPENSVVVIARDEDVFLGILQSKIHELWSLRTGASLEDRPRYTPTTCFETFPFPAGLSPSVSPGELASGAVQIAVKAKELADARDLWLNPPGWCNRISEELPGYPDRLIAKPEHEEQLAKRTLTNLYNALKEANNPLHDNPQIRAIRKLHEDVDTAVATAYGWEWPLSDEEILHRLFALNHARAAPLSIKHKPPTAFTSAI